MGHNLRKNKEFDRSLYCDRRARQVEGMEDLVVQVILFLSYINKTMG